MNTNTVLLNDINSELVGEYISLFDSRADMYEASTQDDFDGIGLLRKDYTRDILDQDIRKVTDYFSDGTFGTIDMQQRMVAVLEDIFSRHNRQQTLVVSHWMAISTVLNYYLGKRSLDHQDFSIDNGSVIILQREGGNTRIMTYNNQKPIN